MAIIKQFISLGNKTYIYKCVDSLYIRHNINLIFIIVIKFGLFAFVYKIIYHSSYRCIQQKILYNSNAHTNTALLKLTYIA